MGNSGGINETLASANLDSLVIAKGRLEIAIEHEPHTHCWMHMKWRYSARSVLDQIETGLPTRKVDHRALIDQRSPNLARSDCFDGRS